MLPTASRACCGQTAAYSIITQPSPANQTALQASTQTYTDSHMTVINATQLPCASELSSKHVTVTGWLLSFNSISFKQISWPKQLQPDHNCARLDLQQSESYLLLLVWNKKINLKITAQSSYSKIVHL